MTTIEETWHAIDPLRKRAEWMVSSGQYRGTVEQYLHNIESIPPGPIRDKQFHERTDAIAKRVVELDRQVEECPSCGGYGVVCWVTGFEATEHQGDCTDCDKRVAERNYLVRIGTELEMRHSLPTYPTAAADRTEGV